MPIAAILGIGGSMEHEVTKRGINHIWHFTRLENLDSILRRGIVPRALLENSELPAVFNDTFRHDGQKGASCFSIGHPNYKMFYSLRQEHKDATWVVLACKANILWEKDCAFCHQNAASGTVTAIPINQRKGPAAFDRLFLPVEGKPSRADLSLPDSCPTDPQAEVLVFGTVEPAFIVGAVCPSTEVAGTLKSSYPGFEFIRKLPRLVDTP
jgi:hypothetical protein